MVPPLAVGEDRQGRVVFIFDAGKDGGGTARRRPVEVASASSEGVEVLSGIREGERVITAGVRRIQDGLRVRLLDASGPSGKALQ